MDKQQTILKQVVSYDTNQSILPTKLASYFLKYAIKLDFGPQLLAISVFDIVSNYAKLDFGPQLLAISVFDIVSNYAKLDLGPKLLVISVFDTASSS